jgi:hypothetical protein
MIVDDLSFCSPNLLFEQINRPLIIPRYLLRMAQQQHLVLTLLISMSLMIVVHTSSLNRLPSHDNQRYQRGFGNRRSLIARLKHTHSNDPQFSLNNDNRLFADQTTFVDPDDDIQLRNDVISYRQQPMILDRSSFE